MNPSATAPSRYRFADLTLDVGRRALLRGDAEIRLGKLTFKLLLALVRAAPNVVTHDRLIEEVWGGRSTSPETITQRVKLLRDALSDSAEHPRYVGLVRNHGYRLIPSVEPLTQEDPQAGSEAPDATRRPHRYRPAAAVVAGASAAIALFATVLLVPSLSVQLAPAWQTRTDQVSAAIRADPVSLAVLPLRNLTGDEGDEYFADGMTEALIASLARISGFGVISRSSVMHYKGSNRSMAEIAEELNVTTVVEGSAQLDGERVRITAQLIDPGTSRLLWAGTFERDVEDVLNLQSEIARHIAEAIEVTLTPTEAERLGATRAVDPETYRAYLRGMHSLGKSTPEDIRTGLQYLHEAVERDPGDALAYAGLAIGYATYGHGPEPQPDVWPRARAAALRAIALDPNLAEAHAALADVKLYMEWDWDGAEQAFLRADELSPGLAMNHYHYAWYLALFERWDEAFAEHERAQRLDPLTPLHTLWLGGLHLYRDLDRHAEATEYARRALELQPDNPMALLILGMAHSAGGRHDEAVAVHRQMVELNPALKWELGLTYSMAGRDDEVRAILDELAGEPATAWTAFGQAMLHAQLGELDQAFAWLDHEPPHAWLPWVRVDPWMRPRLEHDERFQRLLNRLGLPH